MAISFVGAGAVSSGADITGANSVAVPAGVVAGDLLLIVWTANYPVSSEYLPAGWTVVGNQYGQIASNYYPNAGPNQVFLYKFASANETSVPISNLGTTHTRVVMIAYRGVADIDVVGAFNSATNTGPATFSQSTAFNNEYVVSIFSTVTTASIWSVPVSTNERVKVNSTSVFNGLLIVDELKSSAGPTTVRNAGLSSSKLWASGSISLRPTGITGTNLYWVGLSQDWDNSAGNKWSTSSGGTAVYGLNPTAADNVYFDANSFGQISIVNAVANNIICTGFGTEFAGSLGGYGSLRVYGDFTLVSTMFWSFSGTLFFSTSTVGANRVLTNRNITTAGNNLDCTVEFNHVSGSWTLVDNLTVTTTLTLTNGNINGNSNTINCFAFVTNNPTTRSLSNIPTINITGNDSTVLNFNGFAVTGVYNGSSSINLTYAGATGTRRIYLGAATYGRFNLNVVAGSDTITVPAITAGFGACVPWALDFTGFSGTLDLTNGNNSSIVVYSDITFPAAMTMIPGTTQWGIYGYSPNLALAGKPMYAVYLALSSGTATLYGDMVVLTRFDLPGSRFNANNYNVTVGNFVGRAQIGNVNMGNGTWTLTGTGEVWRNDTAESDAAKWVSEGSTIVISDTSAASKTFTNYGGHSSLSYNAIQIAGGAGTGPVIFNNQSAGTVSRLGTVTSTRTAAYTISLPANATTVVTSWLADGANSSNRIRLNSSTPGVQATLSQPSGAINLFNMIIQDIAAAGCATFNANNSQDAGNNTGWGFGGATPPERCVFNFFLVF